MVNEMSDNTNTNTNENRIRIEPQPEALPDGAWLYDGNTYVNSNAMSDYLFDEVYSESLGNSTYFDECESVLIDGVWYWEAW